MKKEKKNSKKNESSKVKGIFGSVVYIIVFIVLLILCIILPIGSIITTGHTVDYFSPVTDYFCKEQISFDLAERTILQKGEMHKIPGSDYSINASQIFEGNNQPGQAIIEFYLYSEKINRIRLEEGDGPCSTHPCFKVILHEISEDSVELSIYLLEREPSRVDSFFNSIT